MRDLDGLPSPQRGWAIAAIALGISLAVIDSAIANVALPQIAADLDALPAQSVWIVNGYQLAVTVCLLPLAALGDRIGYRKVYLSGLGLFTLASLCCALATSLPLLAAARILQGLGAAGIMSVNTALLRYIYPQRLLGRGIGLNALTVALAATAGPALASAILLVAPWPWLFAVNLPIGLTALWLGLAFLPHTPASAHSFDWLGALLSAATFGLIIGSIDALGQGQAFGLFVVEVLAGGVLAWILVRHQLRNPSPVLPIDLLRIPVFALSVATSICAFAAQMLALVSLPFMLHERGYDAVATGLLITPWPLCAGLAALAAGRLSDHYPAAVLGGAGLSGFALGLVSLAFLPERADVIDIAWRMALCGAGFGAFQSPNNRALITSAPKTRSGGASGMLGTARLLGQTLGTAGVALIFARLPQDAGSTSLSLAAGCALLAAAVSLLRLSGRSGPDDGSMSHSGAPPPPAPDLSAH